MVTRPSLFPEMGILSPMPAKYGVLPYQQILGYIDANYISADEPIDESQIQPSSLDLRLGAIGYQVKASFLPGEKQTVLGMVESLGGTRIDISKPTVLEKDKVYIFPVLEELSLPTTTMGKANPKSTTGRLDVFARLIVDKGEHFDSVPEGYRGGLFVEVAPRSFEVLVHSGSRLNQLRLFRGTGSQSDNQLTELRKNEPLVFHPDGTPG
jgi:dCTP deaminase